MSQEDKTLYLIRAVVSVQYAEETVAPHLRIEKYQRLVEGWLLELGIGELTKHTENMHTVVELTLVP